MSKRSKERRAQAALQQRQPETAGKPWQIWVIRFCSYAAICVALLSPMGIDNYTLPKATFFQILAEIAAGAWLTLIINDRRYRPNFGNPLVIAVLAYLAALFIALPFSGDPSRAFWSTYIRMDGIINILHFATWFLMLSSTYRNWDEWKSLLRWFNLVGLIISLYGLIQFSGSHGQRVLSTIGNALYFGVFTLLITFIAVILLSQARNWVGRVGYGISVAIHVAALVLASGSRSSDLGLFIGFIFIAVYLMLAWLRGWKRIVFGILSLLVIGSLGGGTYYLRTKAPDWGNQHLPPVISRLVYSNFGTDRASLWAIAFEGVREKPIFGWGMENYGPVFNKYYQPTGRDASLTEPWYDRAHNMFIDTLVSTGIVGFAAYLLVWLTAFFVLWRASRRTEDKVERARYAMIAAGLLAFAVQMTFTFEITVSGLLFYLLLALTASSANKPADEPGAPFIAKEQQPIFIVIVAAATLWLVISLNVIPFSKVKTAVKAFTLVGADPAAAYVMFKDALSGSWNFATPDIRQRMSEGVRSVYIYGQPKLRQSSVELARFTLAEMDKQMDDRPFDYKTIMMVAYTYRGVAELDPAYLTHAEELVNRALAMSPQRPEAYEEMAEISMLRGQNDKALSWSQQALNHTRFAGIIGRIRFRSAIIYAKKGDAASATEEFDGSTGYDFSKDFRLGIPLGLAMPDGRPNPSAIRYVDTLARAYPTQADVIHAYILIHWKSGDRETAQKMLNGLQTNYPDFYQAIKAELGLK